MHIVTLLLLLAGASSDVPSFTEEVIFPPVPMHTHSASIVETPAGDLLACWFYGHGEKTDDTLVIQGARKKPGGLWSEPFLLADNQDMPDQNPVLFVDPQQTLWLFWISSLDNTNRTYLISYMTSKDFGGDGPPVWQERKILPCRPSNFTERFMSASANYAEPYGASFDSEPKYRERLAAARQAASDTLWPRIGWMPRACPIMLSEHKLVIGLYSDVFLCSIAAWTDDSGKTWRFGEPMAGYGPIQPSLALKRDGTLAAFMRDKSPAKRIRYAESKDSGQTWGPVRNLEIPNPDSSVACAVLSSGKWLLICNDTTGGSRGGRTRLTAFLSDDEGATWKWRRVMEDHDESCAAAYPTAIQAKDGLIHCVYTYSPSPNETIKHVVFNESWLTQEAYQVSSSK